MKPRNEHPRLPVLEADPEFQPGVDEAPSEIDRRDMMKLLAAGSSGRARRHVQVMPARSRAPAAASALSIELWLTSPSGSGKPQSSTGAPTARAIRTVGAGGVKVSCRNRR